MASDTESTMRLQNKTALITGAARGLGASVARLFHAEGANLVLADVLDDEAGALARTLGSRALALHLDVGDEQGWTGVVRRTVEQYGGLHVLVNNAGIYRVKPLLETSTDDYLKIVRINQVGCFLGMRLCAEPMRAAGGGSIVNIASTAGLEGVAGALPYTASKHAVVGMTRAAALELAASQIRVNVVCPGGMATPLLVESLGMPLDALMKMDIPWNPLRRMGHPDEIAKAVLFLASDESSYATGSVVTIDGGLMAGIPSASQSQ
jgi:3alpha(or 20beta)-hydroxysteroid dehydrogenase